MPRSRTVRRRRMPEMFVVTSQGVRHAAGCSVPDHTISTPPENTSVAPACWVRGLAARIQRYTTWERGLPARLQRYATWVRGLPARMPGGAGFQLACRGRGLPARMPGARASRPHAGYAGFQPAYRDTPPGCAGFQPAYDAPPRSTGVQPAYSDTPPGSAGVAPACRVRRRRARIQRYTPSPLHRMGARASSPHAGCTGIAPAYSDTPHHPCTAWVRGLPARMPRAEGHTWQRQWVLDHALTS